MEHVSYPHEAGYLFDCPACESRCHCAGPEFAECVFDGEHQTWSMANHRTEHVTAGEVKHSVRGTIPLTLAEAQTIASWWQSPGSVGHVLASLASGAPFDVRALIDDIDATMRHGKRTDTLSVDMAMYLVALREWAIRLCK